MTADNISPPRRSGPATRSWPTAERTWWTCPPSHSMG